MRISRARSATRCCAIAIASLLLSSLANADDKKSPEEIQRALEKERASTAQLAAKESSLLGRLADLERQVELEGRALKASQTRLRLAQTRFDTANQKVIAAQTDVDDATRVIGPRLLARYQLGREGYVRFLLGARSIGDLLRRKRMYSALLQSDLEALNLLRDRVVIAKAATLEQQAARDEMAQSASAEQERRSTLELKASMQKRALAGVQQEKGLHEQAARELEQAAKNLEAELRAIDAAKQIKSAGVESGKEKAGEKKEEPAPGKKVAVVQPPVATVAPMRAQHGKLLFPVDSGRIEVHYGRTTDPRFGTVTLQRGLDIRAPEGSDVHAVYAGTVVHAGWFSGYGNLVILDHGDGLFTLFAHLATLAHAVGDPVAQGDVLGTLGDTGSLKGPYLYFELRDGQKPVDPEKWLSRSRRATAKK